MDKKTNFKTFIGIDVSKKTLDICIINESGILMTKDKIENSEKVIASHFKKLAKNHLKELSVICFEDTGAYSNLIGSVLNFQLWNIWKVPAIEIKRSLGIKRGKSDSTDARDIALYALSNEFKFKPFQETPNDIKKLKLLKTERDKIIECIKQMGSTTENINFYSKDVLKDLLKNNAKTIKALKLSLAEIEEKIKQIINENDKIKNQIALVQSIPGIGLNTALYLVIVTNQFESFKEWRKMACYAGCAPFEYSSGTSLRGRNKVNHLADKKIKSLLHMCAMAAISNNKEMKVYYQRKKDEGKHSMLVLNNVKCKLLARIFSVVNRNQPFVETFKWVA